MEEEVKKVDLITLLRTFKKEGLDNFIVIRKEKFENNFIPKSKVKEKIEEIQKEYEETLKTANFKEIEKMNNINFRGITLEGQRSILRELLEKRK